MNFLSEKKYGVPSHNFVKKNVLCEKGDEITRFDGTQQIKIKIKKTMLHKSQRAGQLDFQDRK